MDAQDAAEYLGVSLPTLYDYAKKGHIPWSPHPDPTRKYLFDRKRLDEWDMEGRPTPAPQVPAKDWRKTLAQMSRTRSGEAEGIHRLSVRLYWLPHAIRAGGPHSGSIAKWMRFLWDEDEWSAPHDPPNPQTVGRWHNGETDPPAWYIGVICQRLDLSPSWLLFGDGAP